MRAEFEARSSVYQFISKTLYAIRANVLKCWLIFFTLDFKSYLEQMQNIHGLGLLSAFDDTRSLKNDVLV